MTFLPEVDDLKYLHVASYFQNPEILEFQKENVNQIDCEIADLIGIYNMDTDDSMYNYADNNNLFYLSPSKIILFKF